VLTPGRFDICESTQELRPVPDVGASQFLTISQIANVRDDKIEERIDFVTKRFGNLW
jgi:hypothetical protein